MVIARARRPKGRRTHTVDIVCDYFRIFYSAPVGEGRRPFSKQRRIVTNGSPEITLGDIPDQTRIFHVNAPRQFLRDKRLEPRERPRFYFVGLLIQTSTKRPSPSSLNRTPFTVPSAWTCALATPPPDIQRNSVRSRFDSPPARFKSPLSDRLHIIALPFLRR
jgi:hypothetical protein